MPTYEEANTQIKETIEKVVSNYHHRDAQKYPDGSIGTVVISPKQLKEELFQMYLEGWNDH